MSDTRVSTVQKVSVLTLTGLVVGSMVGGGVFTLPGQFGAATGVLGAIIAWVLAGTGMLMLALVFQSLAVRRPDLDSGVYIYAQTALATTWASTPPSATGPAMSPGTCSSWSSR